LKSVALTVFELLAFNSHDRPLHTHTQTDKQTHIHLAEIITTHVTR